MLSKTSAAWALAQLCALVVATPATTRSITKRAVWQPTAGTTWDIDLQDEVDIDSDSPSLPNDVEVYDFDLFGNTGNTADPSSVDTAKIDALHSINKKVICYFSAGSYEPDRPDSDKFQESDKGHELDGWPGEFWLDLRSANVAKIMQNRIAVAAAAGCDAVDPDNMDGYDNTNDLGLEEQDSIDFMKNILAPAAHQNGMAVGLKNAGSIVDRLADTVEFSVNEQCAQYNESDTFLPFINLNKPIFHIEYPAGDSDVPEVLSKEEAAKYCVEDGAGTDITQFSTVLKLMSLNTWTETCDGKIHEATQ